MVIILKHHQFFLSRCRTTAYLQLQDLKTGTPSPPSPFGSPKVMGFSNMNDMMKDLNKMMSGMGGGMGMQSGTTQLKLEMHEYKDMGLAVGDRQWFDNAIEKIDGVLELLPYHLDPKKVPTEISEIIYKFDSKSIRWRINTISSEKKKYVFIEDTWKEIT